MLQPNCLVLEHHWSDAWTIKILFDKFNYQQLKKKKEDLVINNKKTWGYIVIGTYLILGNWGDTLILI